MISSVIHGTERAVSKLLVWLLCLMILGLFLLVGLSFVGYAFFLILLAWFSPIFSALITGCVFLLGVLLCLLAIKHCLPRKVKSGKHAEERASQGPKSMIQHNPAMSLSLSVAAGFLYQSDPRLQEQLSKILVTLADQYIAELSEQGEAAKQSKADDKL